MARIAFLRSIELSQTRPYLAETVAALPAGDEARLFFTDGEVGVEDFPGPATRLRPDVGVDELVRRILEWGADVVVSLSIPDENAIRDAAVAATLRERGVRVVMHDLDATVLFADKARTKELFDWFEIPSPPGFAVDGDVLNGRSVPVPGYRESVARRAEDLGFPVIVKPLWDCLGNGMQVLRDAAELTAWLARPHDGNVLVEKFVTGEIGTVELVGNADSVMVQPPLWMGPTGLEAVFTLDRVRFARPRPALDDRLREVTVRLARMLRATGLDGAVDVDVIWDGTDLRVLEVNPRVSGATTLSVAASGCSTYDALLELGRDQWEGPAVWHAPHDRIALQVPVADDVDGHDTLDALGDGVRLVRHATYHVNGRTLPNIVVTADVHDADAVCAAFEPALRARLISPAAMAAIRHVMTDPPVPSVPSSLPRRELLSA